MVNEFKTKYSLFCDHCNWRRTSDLSDFSSDLREVQGCSHCSGKKYKCPTCGFTIKLRKFYEAIKKEEDKSG